MKNKLRRIIEECILWHKDNPVKKPLLTNPDKLDQALSDTLKLFDAAIGEDREDTTDPTSCEPVNEMDRGYNRRAYDIRKRMGE